MTYEHLLLDIQDHIGVIKLNRPEVLNAMNRRLFGEIDEAVTQLENDDDVHAIIFTGAGERAFSAGADIHEMAEQARSRTIRLPRTLAEPSTHGTSPPRGSRRSAR